MGYNLELAVPVLTLRLTVSLVATECMSGIVIILSDHLHTQPTIGLGTNYWPILLKPQ
jgi:hypothetical protein